MSNEEIINTIIKNPQLISALAEKVYDKLKDEIVIKKLEENTQAIKELQIVIVELQKNVNEHNRILGEHSKAIQDLQKAVNEHSEAIRGLQIAVNENTKAIQDLQKTVDEHTKAIQELQKSVNEHTKAIQDLQKAVIEHSKAIQDLQKAVNEHSEAIRGLQNAVNEHSKVIQELVYEQRKLSVEIGSFTNRAGRNMEKTILMLYKKALELHGVNADKVIHGNIIDTLGVIEKDRVFEVDFYETNDYIYVFEIKNFADEGAYEQMLNRKKLFSALYNKPLKLFLVANYVRKDIRELLEKEGVIVISSVDVE
ncbi:hypothetical protein GFS03_03820 [Sulfolobus sp. E5-1-F]|uniref:hypothetical protein n=1 Tax=Saccharolobus sp. E5-1-F TaxID=2663019 RepID=UPI001294D8C5|nr:hypothetical protein [Sulfolobus sp. E5-1-F]QGA53777.1 hypothetical protein GFS03_03820 [Sulfolobus sp. E5-1-F]